MSKYIPYEDEAKDGYTAFGESLSASGFGECIPWDRMPDQLKSAWCAAAEAVVSKWSERSDPRERVMKIWLLVTSDAHADYDTADGFVVRANNATRARWLASNDCGTEGPAHWTDTSKSRCVLLGTARLESEGVVLRDFRHS